MGAERDPRPAGGDRGGPSLIPEAIAFSIIAWVDPKVGLYASFCIAVVTAIAGGRPAMISAATGAMALVMVTLVRDHGLAFLCAATILTGLLQLLAAASCLGDLMRFVSRSVVTGFVNALAILIFLAQMPAGADAGADRAGLAGLPDGRGGPRHHLPAAAADPGRPLAAGHRGGTGAGMARGPRKLVRRRRS
jgi:hypothetical protein